MMAAARCIATLYAKCDDLAQPHSQAHTDLRNSVEHRACQRLSFLRERVADDDETDSEQNVSAEGSGDLRPECKVPVVPGRVQECHGEGRASTDDARASNEPASGYAVHKGTNQQTENDACDQVW